MKIALPVYGVGERSSVVHVDSPAREPVGVGEFGFKRSAEVVRQADDDLIVPVELEDLLGVWDGVLDEFTDRWVLAEIFAYLLE